MSIYNYAFFFGNKKYIVFLQYLINVAHVGRADERFEPRCGGTVSVSMFRDLLDVAATRKLFKHLI